RVIEDAQPSAARQHRVRGQALSRDATLTRIKPLITIAVFVWLSYLVTSSQPNIALHVYSATVRLQALYLALGISYAGILAVRRRLPPTTRLDWPLLALVAVYLAATAFSIYPRLSLET